MSEAIVVPTKQEYKLLESFGFSYSGSLSWNHIMRIVEKIEATKGFTVGIVNKGVHIMKDGHVVATGLSGNKIQSAYSAIIEHIQDNIKIK